MKQLPISGRLALIADPSPRDAGYASARDAGHASLLGGLLLLLRPARR